MTCPPEDDMAGMMISSCTEVPEISERAPSPPTSTIDRRSVNSPTDRRTAAMVNKPLRRGAMAFSVLRANAIEVRELYGTMDLTHFISRLAPAFSKKILQIF